MIDYTLHCTVQYPGRLPSQLPELYLQTSRDKWIKSLSLTKKLDQQSKLHVLRSHWFVSFTLLNHVRHLDLALRITGCMNGLLKEAQVADGAKT
jgi:hypothetical protein